MNRVVALIAFQLALLLAPASAWSAEEVAAKSSAPPKTRMTAAQVSKIALALAKKNRVPMSKYVQGDASIDSDIPELTWWVWFHRKDMKVMNGCYIVWVVDATAKSRFVPCCPDGVC